MSYELSEEDNALQEQLEYLALTTLAERLHQAQVDKGFYDEPLNIDRKLMLIHSEVSEAGEELRDNEDPHHVYYREGDGKPEGFTFELADAFIRICDLAGALGINLGEVVKEKHNFNLTRPHKHGRLY